MKINLDVNELKELVKILTPQVTVIDGGTPQVISGTPQQLSSTLTPLQTMSEVQTSEKDYFAAVAKFSEPTQADKAEALAIAVANGFEYESKPNGKNGKEHVSLAADISAANSLLPGN